MWNISGMGDLMRPTPAGRLAAFPILPGSRGHDRT